MHANTHVARCTLHDEEDTATIHKQQIWRAICATAKSENANDNDNGDGVECARNQNQNPRDSVKIGIENRST